MKAITYGHQKYKAQGRLDQIDGQYLIPHQRIKGYFYVIVASTGLGWDHVSVSLISRLRKVERCPTWEDMCFVKDLFFRKDEVVIQYHPKEDDYVSMHPYCLHLWRPQGVELPTPDPIMVGIKS